MTFNDGFQLLDMALIGGMSHLGFAKSALRFQCATLDVQNGLRNLRFVFDVSYCASHVEYRRCTGNTCHDVH